MKKRLGFVSNSSSSSFVIINASSGLIKFTSKLIFGNRGETEFGWGPSDIADVDSRINFAYLQTKYSSKKEYLKMLEDVIHLHTESNEPIIWKLFLWGEKGCDEIDSREGYIDHQSSAYEGQNTEIFETPDILRNFLFGKLSYIHLDNDNDDRYE